MSGAIDMAKIRAEDATEDFQALAQAMPQLLPFSALHPVFVGQWALETNWGRSDLARHHANFAGIEWSGLFGELGVPVPHPTDPNRGKFCRFLSAETFLRAYKHRLDNDPAFVGWTNATGNAQQFATFLGRTWRPANAEYAEKILNLANRISSQDGGQGGGPGPASGTGSAIGTGVEGIVLQVRRLRAERRSGQGERTVSTYQLLADGQPVAGVSGMLLEPRGPGDNSATGTARKLRIQAGVYPLFTHAGAPAKNGVTKYRTIGFTSDTTAFAVSRPSIKLGETNFRSGILIHPGSGYLTSVGCLNASKSLADASGNMEWADSRTRVIKLIDELRRLLGESFPEGNNQRIRGASIEVIGEPGPVGTDTLAEAATFDRLEYARQSLAVARGALDDLAVTGPGDALAAPDMVAIHDALGALIYEASVIGEPEDGRIDRIADQGIALSEVRDQSGETLWVDWALSMSVASRLENDEAQAVIDRLRQIATLLHASGVEIDDAAGLHSALARISMANDVPVMQALPDEGAQPDQIDGSGASPLALAAFHAAPVAVDLLLSRGADPGQQVRPPGRAMDEGVNEVEVPPVGADAAGCAAEGAALFGQDLARFEDYERVSALIWKILNPT